MKNISKEEEEEARLMQLRFEETLQTLKASTKENTEARELLMKLTKKSSKSLDWQSKQNIGETSRQH